MCLLWEGTVFKIQFSISRLLKGPIAFTELRSIRIRAFIKIWEKKYFISNLSFYLPYQFIIIKSLKSQVLTFHDFKISRTNFLWGLYICRTSLFNSTSVTTCHQLQSTKLSYSGKKSESFENFSLSFKIKTLSMPFSPQETINKFSKIKLWNIFVTWFCGIFVKMRKWEGKMNVKFPVKSFLNKTCGHFTTDKKCHYHGTWMSVEKVSWCF